MARVNTGPGVGSIGETGQEGITGDVTLTEGSNITLTQSGNDITIASTGGAGVSDGDKGDITVSGGGTVWDIDAATVGTTELSATGTPSSSTYLRGDNTWATIAGGGDVVGPSSATDNAIARFDTTTGKLIQNSGVTIDDEGTLALMAGNTNYPPFDMVSGIVTSTAVAGAIEYDGKVHYGTHESSARGVIPEEQFITLTSAYTIPTEGGGLRAMFNSPASGAVTVKSNTSYWFECIGALSSLSTSSGTFSFGFLGTASTPRIRYMALANKGAVTPVAALLTNVTTTSSTALVAATLIATAQFSIKGKVVVETGGTLIPAIGHSVIANPIVGVDSTFRIYPIGSQTVQSVGNWS